MHHINIMDTNLDTSTLSVDTEGNIVSVQSVTLDSIQSKVNDLTEQIQSRDTLIATAQKERDAMQKELDSLSALINKSSAAKMQLSPAGIK